MTGEDSIIQLTVTNKDNIINIVYTGESIAIQRFSSNGNEIDDINVIDTNNTNFIKISKSSKSKNII